MQDLELKRAKIEKIVGGGLLLVLGFVVAPFIYIALKGLAGLMVAGGVIAVSYYSAPAVGRWLGNMRIKALKAVAAADPISTLQNIYREKKEALIKQRDNIKQLISVKSKIKDQIAAYKERFGKASPRQASYDQLELLINVTMQKYERAQRGLVNFGELIEEKAADWDIACSMAEASKLAKLGEDFVSKLMQDTSFTTIQDGLNMALAELDASVMDENIQKTLAGEVVQIQVEPAQVAAPKAAKALPAPSKFADLSFDFDGQPEQEPILAGRRQRIATN